jgi:hypothetical protein
LVIYKNWTEMQGQQNIKFCNALQVVSDCNFTYITKSLVQAVRWGNKSDKVKKEQSYTVMKPHVLIFNSNYKQHICWLCRFVSIIVAVKNKKQADQFNPEEGSNIHLQNTGFLLQGYTLS